MGIVGGAHHAVQQTFNIYKESIVFFKRIIFECEMKISSPFLKNTFLARCEFCLRMKQ